MNEAIIQISFINPPKPGKKNGTIKDKDNGLWLAKPPLLAQLQQGGQYKIGYEEFSMGGTTFREIKSFQQIGSAPVGSPQAVTHRPDVSPDVARRMFVGAWGHGVMANPNLKPFEMGPQAIATLIALLEAGYDLHYSKVKPTNDMSDEIPDKW